MADLGTINKSILIIDTPRNCDACPCATGTYKNVCGADYDKRYVDDYIDNGRPEWCPLKDVEIKPEVNNENTK